MLSASARADLRPAGGACTRQRWGWLLCAVAVFPIIGWPIAIAGTLIAGTLRSTRGSPGFSGSFLPHGRIMHTLEAVNQARQHTKWGVAWPHDLCDTGLTRLELQGDPSHERRRRHEPVPAARDPGQCAVRSGRARAQPDVHLPLRRRESQGGRGGGTHCCRGRGGETLAPRADGCRHPGDGTFGGRLEHHLRARRESTHRPRTSRSIPGTCRPASR